MADDAIAISEGSGTNIDTRTEGTNGNHRQVIVVGDPATNAGVAPVDATNGLAVDVKANGVVGEVQATPTANTILGRLKALEDAAAASLPAGTAHIGNVQMDFAYKTVAASQTDQALGAAGAAGDYISHIIVIPTSVSPGAIHIEDNAASNISVFAGGTDSLLTLHPFVVPIGAASAAGAWTITTGANLSCIVVGKFTES